MPGPSTKNTVKTSKMNLTEQVRTASLKAENVKVSIYQAVHREYNDLLPSKTQHELIKAVKPLLNDIQKLENKFETEVKPKIHAATTQHKDLLEEYQKIKSTTDLLKKLCSSHKELTACKSSEVNQFVKRATHLQTVKKELESMKFPESDIKIFKAVRNEYINQQTKLAIDLNDVWERLIVWNTSPVASWDSLDGHLKTFIKIDSAAGSDIKLADYFQALHLHQLLNKKLKSFSQKVYSYLLKPLIKFQNLTPITQSKDSHYHILKITKKKVTAQKITKAASCVLLYKKILETIQYLKMALFASLDNNDQELKPLETIGSYVWKELAETIIKDHLSAAVPSSNSQMEKYESTIEETIQFEKDLLNEGFLTSDVEILSKYIKEVNVHFANKVCQDILSEARDIILTEMHNTITVGMTNDRAAISMPAEGEILNKKIKNMLLGLESVEDEFLHVNSFAFPSCYISDNIQKLMDFVFRNMIKATESPYPMACQIVHSCRDIFDLFVNVVPTYHQENLKLPRLAALHYNNCMYLAHHCITLGHQFQNSLSGQLNSSITTFVDLVPVLRKCGTDCFLEQLRTQQKELLHMLEPCEQFTQCVTEEGSETIRRSFNQIIHHLTRVAKQWDDVLPVNIFKQSIAVLMNTVLENCIAAVLKMEDISAEEAGQLHTLLNLLVDRSPQIIQSCSTIVVESGINDQIRSWKKFEHIIKLLEASLQEIVDTWAGGEGSLALCMNEGEVRTLIRALFQNTDRRSQALAKIKNKHTSG